MFLVDRDSHRLSQSLKKLHTQTNNRATNSGVYATKQTQKDRKVLSFYEVGGFNPLYSGFGHEQISAEWIFG